MKTFLIALTFLIPSLSFAARDCFLIKDLKNGKTIKKEGMCDTSSAPNSTFKIPLAVMGFDSRILVDSTHPEWPYKKEYNATREGQKQALNPKTWLSASALWYSRMLVEKMGAEKFKFYVDSFDYGNKDVTGDKGKNNSLTNSWVSSSLQITPTQQIDFLMKLLKAELPVTGDAHIKTREIMFVENLGNGWQLYGKTGTGYQSNKDGGLDLDKQVGWFVGWVTNDVSTYVFARRILDDKKNSEPGGPRAKEQVKELLKINKLLN